MIYFFILLSRVQWHYAVLRIENLKKKFNAIPMTLNPLQPPAELLSKFIG